MITLRLIRQPTVPLEAECLSPDRLAEQSNAEICEARVYHGKRQLRVDEFFEVEGERSDIVEVHGDLQRVRHLGRQMSRGSMTIHGDVGMHLGAHMSGGSIEVHGNVSDWLGGEMKGGRIHVHGRGGQQLGAAYRGSPMGMRGGTIVVEQGAGIEIGMRMRRGLIIVGGRAGDFVGLQMKGGTIVLCEGAEIRTGAWMQRGTIISLTEIPLMPTFTYSGSYNPTFANILAGRLAQWGKTLPFDATEGVYNRYCGDNAIPGKGEVLVWQPHTSD
ncbi:MAG: formylmethanofuran dehydrogenase subunit C [Planctomycetota bacterium]